MNGIEWRQEYHPCHTGLHVFQPEGGKYGALTIANFEFADAEKIRQLSSAGDGDDFDLMIDVMDGGDLIDCFCIRRQDLAIIERALKAEPFP